MRRLIFILLIGFLLGCEGQSKTQNEQKEKLLTCGSNDTLEGYYTSEEKYDFTFSDEKKLREYTTQLIFNYGNQLSEQNKIESYEQSFQL